MYQVLLYYHYTPIQDPDQLRDQQFELAQRLGMKGRILISDQGINGTASGTPEAVEKYMAATNAYPGLEQLEWKISEADTHVFPRLRVVVRPEIVTLGLKAQDIDVDLNHKAPYIEPEDLLKLYEEDEDFIIIDARNDYETKIGTFKDAMVPPIKNFREFPEYVQQNLADKKDRPVVTFCTGGIRCEKASAYLKEQGFTNVRQLHGGIHRYSDTTGGKNFQGKMYVFDDRIQVEVNTVNPSTIAKCQLCNQPSDTYRDCVNDSCNKSFIGCETCVEPLAGACSEACLAEYQKLDQMKRVFVSMMVNQDQLFI